MKNRNPQLIKYDKQDYKISLFVAGTVTIGTVLLYFLLASDTMPDNTITAFLYLLEMISPMIVLVCWMYVLDIYTYLYRLKKHGYDVPPHKKIYGYRLGNLSRSKECVTSENSRESMTIAGICFVCAVAIPLWILGMWMEYDYHLLQNIKNQGYVILFAVLAVWLAEGIRYWKQRTNTKFRDDVELDDSRKQRKQIADGMGEIFALFGFTFLLPTVIMHFLDVIARTRM